MKMEPVSPSNRFNFDLLAEYNLAAPSERKVQAKDEKKSADGELKSQDAQKSQAASPPPVPHALGRQPGRPPYAAQPQPASPRPMRTPPHNLNPANATHGGPQ
jgi:hypothetical protein